MLTREHEGGRQQAHDYWTGEKYGDWRVEVEQEKSLNDRGRVLETGDGSNPMKSFKDEKAEKEKGNGMFPIMEKKAPIDGEEPKGQKGTVEAIESDEPSMMIRTLYLSNVKSKEPRRKITQLHYIAWPDYHIPETPDSLLNFAELASAAQLEADSQPSTTSSFNHKKQIQASSNGSPGPMLVHCSAGVGRTGTFIVIDAALEILRKFRAKQRGQGSPSTWDDGTGSLGRDEALASSQQHRKSSDGDSIMSESGSVPFTPPRDPSKQLELSRGTPSSFFNSTETSASARKVSRETCLPPLTNIWRIRALPPLAIIDPNLLSLLMLDLNLAIMDVSISMKQVRKMLSLLVKLNSVDLNPPRALQAARAILL